MPPSGHMTCTCPLECWKVNDMQPISQEENGSSCWMFQGLRSCGRRWRRIGSQWEGRLHQRRSTQPRWSAPSQDIRTEPNPAWLPPKREVAQQSERIKTRQHHQFILYSLTHTLAENQTNSVGLARISLLELAIVDVLLNPGVTRYMWEQLQHICAIRQSKGGGVPAAYIICFQAALEM